MFRDDFVIPKDRMYFLGNSLGLQPKRTREMVNEVLDAWNAHGVSAHFRGEKPWLKFDQMIKKSVARIVGASEFEVAITGQLTMDLHLLLSRFYHPTETRSKIICDRKPFPSDMYALESAIRAKNLDPESALIATDDVIRALETSSPEEIALVVLGVPNYYDCKMYDIRAIVDAAHSKGALVLLDCAHAVGILPLNLHANDVDGAVWCSYKYLNSGPAAPGGIFVHKKHLENLPGPGQLLGWWGHEESTRFEMDNMFVPSAGADSFRLSNIPILSAAPMLASMEIYDKTSIEEIREKSLELTDYLMHLVDTDENLNQKFEIINPREPKNRGGHVALKWRGGDSECREIYKKIGQAGIDIDYRKPSVIRLAPSPLYNTKDELDTFVQTLRDIC
jgi:kynureninase